MGKIRGTSHHREATLSTGELADEGRAVDKTLTTPVPF
jgi:hypothetical protein